MTILVTLLRKIARFLYFHAASLLAHSRLISPPQWLIDMRKCPTISPDEIQTFLFIILVIVISILLKPTFGQN